MHADDNQETAAAMPESNNQNNKYEPRDMSHLDISPATLEALKTLSAVSTSEGIDKLSNCDKITASLEQIRANKNMRLFEKLDKIRQDFSGLNNKIAQMEESILDLKEVTSNLVKSLPPDKEANDERLLEKGE